MRPNASVAERHGDLGGEKVQMTFDQNSLSHLMSVLTDLYSDPELAVIREYSTNALDAQIRAGVDRPIEVTTPNTIAPFFRVKDYGIGMNAQDIKEVYSQYGASTKRDSDEFTGMLGLGCKAALTYTNQFTVTAVKDGIRTQVVVSRTEDGSGVMEIMSEKPSDEHNGVEITVPVKKYNQFETKSNEFFRFWDDGTVLLNGKPVERISGRDVSENMVVVPGLNMDYIVMGNVAYPLDNEFQIATRNWQMRTGIVARVDIGDVSFTPSREALHYTMRTKNTIERLKTEYQENVKVALQRDVDAAETKREAILALYDWSMIIHGNMNRMATQPVLYNGEEIPVFVREEHISFNVDSSRYATDNNHGFNSKDGLSATVLYGFEGTKLASYHREKIRLWIAEKGLQVRRVLIFNELPNFFGDWSTLDKVHSWDDVRAVKRPKKAVAKREAVMYDVYETATGSSRYRTLDEIDDETEKALVSPAELKNVSDTFFQKIRATCPNVMVVRIATTRWDKFRRDNKNVTTLREYIEREYNKSVDELTEADKIYMGMRWDFRGAFTRIDVSAILDDRLAEFLKVSNTATESDRIKRYNVLRSLMGEMSMFRPQISITDYNPLDTYPLLETIKTHHAASHAAEYANMVYTRQL